MHHITQNFTQVQTVFGGEFVQEQHGDDTHRYLPQTERHDFVADFDVVLKALRAALSL